MRITVSEINIRLIFENICSSFGHLNFTNISSLCGKCNGIRKSTGNVQYFDQGIFMQCNYICKYGVPILVEFIGVVGRGERLTGKNYQG